MLYIACASSVNDSKSFRRTSHFALNSDSAFEMPSYPNRLKVAVHPTYDQSLGSSRDQHEIISRVDMDEQLRDKPAHESHFQDAESGL